MWEMVATVYKGDETIEIVYPEKYEDEGFAVNEMNYGDGELFSQDLTIDIKNGRFGDNAHLDAIELRRVKA